MKRMTETVREWLLTREARQEADAAIARMILQGQVAADGPDYLDLALVDDQPRLTYILPEKAAGLSEEERFTKRGARVIGRPGSVVQKVLGTKPDGHAMDRLSQSAGFFLNPPAPAHFALLTGEEVWRVFDTHNTCTCDPYNMIRSCMTGPGDQRARRPGLALYERHAQMAVYTCGTCGKYEARTIVWTDARNGSQWYDRIYGTNRANYALGMMLAERGIAPLRIGYGTKAATRVVIALSPEEMTHYETVYWPALDTMNYLCRTCCTLSNAACGESEGYWSYGRYTSHGPLDPLIARLGGTDDAASTRGEETS